MRGFLALLSYLLLTGTVLAEVPQQLHYNGYLTNAVGEAVNCPDAIQCAESYELSFKLYASAEGGSPIWEEVYQGVPIFGGSFHAVLGGINPVSAELLSGDTWLAVKVNGNAEMLPRQKLASGAFALRAAHAEQAVEAVNATQLGGVDAGDYALTEQLPTGDNDALGALICAEGMIAKMSALGWACGLDETGSVDTTLTEAEVDLMVANNGYLTTYVDTNTQLNEAEVDAMVANNGYATQTEVSANAGATGLLQTELTAVQTTLGTLQDELTALEGVVEQHNVDISGLQTTVADVQSSLTLVSGQVATLETELDSVKADLAALQGAGVQVAADASACSEVKSGTLRWQDEKLELCDGTDWVVVFTPTPDLNGSTPAAAGLSCHSIFDNGFATGDGQYWIDPDGPGGLGARQAYCDMSSDGGGWTLAMRRTGADWQESWMYNTWDTGSLPTPDTTGNTSWKVPDTATQIRFAFSSDGSNTPTDYIITSAPGSAESNTGMWFNSPSTADYDVTLFHNGVQGLSSSNIRWNFYNDTSSGFSYRCYGVSSGQSFANNCDHSNDLFGAIDDHCPGTNNSEVYIGSRKNIVGSGAGGSYCDTPDPNARWWVWWRDN